MLTTNDWVLVEAYIETARTFVVNGQDTTELDITNHVAEVLVYENIDIPFLTGTLTFVDTSDIVNTVDMHGDEHIHLKWVVNGKGYSKSFVVTEIKTNAKATDNNALIAVSLMEPHGALSYTKELGSVRSGKITDIIKGVFENELNTPLVDEQIEKDSNNPVKILDRGRSPIAVCKSVLDHATDDSYHPMYLYSTLSTGIHLTSTSNLFETHDRPEFIYAPFTSSSNDYATDIKERGRHISHYQEDDGGSFIKRAKKSGVAHEQLVIDPLTGHQELSRVTYETSDIDNGFTILGEKVTSTPITSSLEIVPSNGFSGRVEETLMEETIPEAHKRKTVRMMMDNSLRQFPKTIVVPAFYFHDTPTVGSCIEIVIPKNKAIVSTTPDVIDEQKSGKHVILSTKHVMNTLNNSYDIAMTVSKLDLGTQ